MQEEKEEGGRGTKKLKKDYKNERKMKEGVSKGERECERKEGHNGGRKRTGKKRLSPSVLLDPSS